MQYKTLTILGKYSLLVKNLIEVFALMLLQRTLGTVPYNQIHS